MTFYSKEGKSPTQDGKQPLERDILKPSSKDFAVEDIPKESKGAPKPVKEPKRTIKQTFEEAKEIWFSNKDYETHKADVQADNFQDRIKATIGKGKKEQKNWREVDDAIHLYLDSKRNVAAFKQNAKKLTPEQTALVEKSQNLTPEQKKIAAEIRKEYDDLSNLAKDEGIIRNVMENYVNRAWDLSSEQSQKIFKSFGTSTRIGKHRKLGTIIEGMAAGLDLKIKGATTNLATLKSEILSTIENRNLVKNAMRTKDKDGKTLFSYKPGEGYSQIQHPSFTHWAFSQKTDVIGKPKYTSDTIRTEDGTILKRRTVFAPDAMAKNLNNILGRSALEGSVKIKGTDYSLVDATTKFNAITKAWILQSNFFHHLAFTRSYLLGGALRGVKDTSFRNAYKSGLKAIKELSPEVELLVRNGMTLGKIQDWEMNLLREKSSLGKILQKNKVTGKVADKISSFQEGMARSLFSKYGAGLKAYAGMLEYQRLLKEHPAMEPNQRAKMVANLINDDFGGLHLQRKGRNPTVQHLFRLFALAPDWTESNVRSMVKAVKSGGTREETKLYRKFWTRIATRGLAVTTAANMLMAGFDMEDDEGRDLSYFDAVKRRYKKAWDAGRLRWLDVDISPLHQALGGDPDTRAYFSIFGHFKDPLKFLTSPLTSLQHKGSVVSKIFLESILGKDWRGRRFTGWDELMGVDDKGIYKRNSKKYGYKKGDPKGGKLTGELTKWSYGKSGPISLKETPSYVLSQIRGTQPVQVQNFFSFLEGEMDAFQAILKSMGAHVSVTKDPDKRKKKTKKQKGNFLSRGGK